AMAVPMAWGLLATRSVNGVDTFYVARLGNRPLAALMFTFPVVIVLTRPGTGLAPGSSSAASRDTGGGDAQTAQRLATDAMSLTLLISVSACLLGWLTLEPLFLALGATRDLIPLIREYMALWYFSAPCLMVRMVSLAAVRALGMSQIQ